MLDGNVEQKLCQLQEACIYKTGGGNRNCNAHKQSKMMLAKLAADGVSDACGVVAAERIQSTFKYAKKLHWRQMILLIEILILFVVGFMPGELDMLATVLVSFSCAMQVQTFRKVGGYSYASTMCIGNLRSGTAALSVYCREKRPEQLKQALYYFGIIFFFAIGAGGGGNLSMRLGIPAIWVSDVLLLISFILMFSSKHRD